MVFRVLVEKKDDAAARKLLGELKYWLDLDGLDNLRIVTRYDVEGLDGGVLEEAKFKAFADPAADIIIDGLPQASAGIFAVEPLPGQYDQRADTTAQCLQVLAGGGGRPEVRCAEIYILEGECDVRRVKDYIINKVESREAQLEPYESLALEHGEPGAVETLRGFMHASEAELADLAGDLAMGLDDLLFCQAYFRDSERRDPTVTEIKMLDAYWSDHCRHTTFFTEITDVEIEEACVRDAFEAYLDLRGEVYAGKNKKPVTLMDMATIGAKYLKMQGLLDGLDESEEVNACSVNIKVDVGGAEQDWLLMFKNETHNHPTEIEPFGGASTCLGGAIRDPLAGRAHVYQAMRVTGAADPRPKQKLANKLAQHRIGKIAAEGYSSYGNQIGAAAGGIYEIYHEGYAAKRMELGAVVGAAPKSSVRRGVPEPGDVIILVGGRTGRDGIGAAAGSSKSHSTESLQTSGAEVQKGNAFEERKLVRLFRKAHVSRMIKRCNDFGAGGVSVAIGELADSIAIDLSLVPVKYGGLDGTELATSESQERMAVVVSRDDCENFIREAELENLEATKVAVVTDDGRLKMSWRGEQVLSLTREFLNSNGAPKKAAVAVAGKSREAVDSIFDAMYKKLRHEDIARAYEGLLSDINICGQKGLIEQFDGSAGGNIVIAPLGGEQRLSPAQFMAARIPVLSGSARTCSLMAYGFSPHISEVSPYRGAMYAVVESVSKLIAAGVALEDIYLSFQEYFPAINGSPERFGMPFEALLGALRAQVGLELAAVGGKDSMSGSYTDEHVSIDVPPTLVSFAVGTANEGRIISNEFKKPGSAVYLLKPLYDSDNLVDFADLKNLYAYVSKLIDEGKILGAYAVGLGGIGEAVFKLCAGNGLGFKFRRDIDQRELFASHYGAFVVESKSDLPLGELLGETTAQASININGSGMELNALVHKWLKPLEHIFPTGLAGINADMGEDVPKIDYHVRAQASSGYKFARPRALLAVLPGTTGEYEAAKHFGEAGAHTDEFIFRNGTGAALSESLGELARQISECQIFMLPGGYSGGGGPVGTGMFAAAVCRHPRVRDALRDLLFNRDGLILGIGAGFQALVKLGLLPYGDIKDSVSEPAVYANKIGRHYAGVVYTRVASVRSPWLANVKVGDIHATPVSHGEGRFRADGHMLAELEQHGQIAAQYCDINGEPTMHPYYNPNGSDWAIEALTSSDGRILGKMGHSERIGRNILKNVPGSREQQIFSAGVRYFR